EGLTVTVKDSAAVARTATVFYASTSQVNFLVPGGTAAGTASITLKSPGSPDTVISTEIRTIAPGLFTADASGHGPPAAMAVRKTGGAVPVYTCAASGCATVPIDLLGNIVYVSLFGTGIRNGTNVNCTIG